ILLANPGLPVSTVEVYENLNLDKIHKRPDIKGIIKNMAKDDICSVGKDMANVLEEVTLKKYEIIDKLKKLMIENGALGSLMSGSGPTVFGIFDNEKTLHNCKRVLEN